MNRLAIVMTSVVFLLSFHRAAAAADPDAGRQVFRSVCTLCHDTAEGRNRVGPSLFGVVGRKTGTVPGYVYSDANKNSGLVWTPDVLDRYLVSPQAVVPGTKMGYPGLKDDQKRADVIAYLATLQ